MPPSPRPEPTWIAALLAQPENSSISGAAKGGCDGGAAPGPTFFLGRRESVPHGHSDALRFSVLLVGVGVGVAQDGGEDREESAADHLLLLLMDADEPTELVVGIEDHAVLQDDRALRRRVGSLCKGPQSDDGADRHLEIVLDVIDRVGAHHRSIGHGAGEGFGEKVELVHHRVDDFVLDGFEVRRNSRRRCSRSTRNRHWRRWPKS